MLIKLSAECLTAIGAKSADEFPGKLVALLVTCAGLSATVSKQETTITTMQEAHNVLVASQKTGNETITAQAGKIALIENTLGNPAAMTESKIKEIATIAGSAEAAKALGETGTTPPAPPAQTAAGGGTGSEQFTSLIKAGKYEEAFAFGNAELKAEFSSAKAYASYMKNSKAGRVSITENRNRTS